MDPASGAASFYGDPLSLVHDRGFSGGSRLAAECALSELEAAGHRRGRATDLGCGSGVLLRRMADAGYDVAGTDRSPAMIRRARDRVPEAELEVGSVYDYAIPRSVAVTAVGEVFNYLPAPSDSVALSRLFRRVHRALERGGVFLFDLLEARADVADYTRSTERRGEGWRVQAESRWSPEGPSVIRDIHVELDDGRVSREVHRCRLLDPEALKRELEAVGFRVARRRGYGPQPLPGPRSVLVGARV